MSRFRYAIVPVDNVVPRLVEAAARLGLASLPVGAGLVAFVSNSSVDWVQISGGSALIGRVFPRSAYGPSASAAILDEADFDIDRFGTRYWGDFLFVRQSAHGYEFCRSPSARWPVYWARYQNGILVASDPDLLIGLGVIDGRVDWDNCLQHLVRFEQPLERTALSGMYEVLPGFKLHSGTTCERQTSWWDPWSFHDDRERVDSSVWPEQLRSVVTACVRAHTQEASRLLVRVSGGLDSSIVAASLADKDTRARLMVLIAGDGDGDERHYARLLADKLGLPLIEQRYGATDIDLDAASFPDFPVPRGRHTMQSVRRICDQALGESVRGSVLTGFGGDALFGYMMSVRTIVDHLRDEGLWKARRSVVDLARMTDSSVIEALDKTIRHLGRGRLGYSPGADALFINPARLCEVPEPDAHPWLVPRGRPGKSLHIGMILGTLRNMDHSLATDERSEIAPLMSQPVIETCLRIPSWAWSAGGRDRAIARSAFEHLLPPAISNRCSKGGPDAFCSRILEERREELRERLLDGELARHDVIDRQAIEAAFHSDRPLAPLPTLRLLQLSDAEAWVAARLSRQRAPGDGSASQSIA